ncbi:MAG: FHA domain-containing protein [Candidatus Eremiobacteraeota bacterium]|nr:FHA domain-containing protein [Candidatus Eremiobacteraeota bacterium]
MYVIEAMDGPLDGQRWAFAREIIIGRDAACAQAALTTDSAVSRRHALVAIDGGTITLSDLGSRNGTLLAGAPIGAPALLSLGQPFKVGRTTLSVLTDEDPPEQGR